MDNSESLLENETYKIRWDFEIQTDHLFSANQLDEKKITRWIVDFDVSTDHRMKIKIKKVKRKEKYQDLARENWKKYGTLEWWGYQL